MPQPTPVKHLVESRLALRALDYPIPARANRLDFMLGALTLAALTVLAVTGIVLTQFYNPSPLDAQASVQAIITTMPLIGYLRDVHAWSASAAVLLVFAHLSFVFWRRGYRNPREALWWSGVLLLALLFGLAFTGSVLRSDQEAIEALAHAIAGSAFMGPLGAPFQPGFSNSAPPIARYYAMHVSIFPLLLVGLLALHLWLIRHLGVSATGEARDTFRSHLRPMSGFALLVVGLVAGVALLWPTDLLAPGVAGFEVTKPSWAFLWIYAAENLAGIPGMLLAPVLLFGFLAVAPLTDQPGSKLSGVTRAAGATLLTLLVAACVYAWIAPAQVHLH